jgi:hypothetical protein
LKSLRERTRADILSELDRLDDIEDSLRAERAAATYKLEQVITEKARLRRHLGRCSFAAERGENAAYRRKNGADG